MPFTTARLHSSVETPVVEGKQYKPWQANQTCNMSILFSYSRSVVYYLLQHTWYMFATVLAQHVDTILS